jgi:hypothetical protein
MTAAEQVVAGNRLEKLRLRMLDENITLSRYQWEELLAELNPVEWLPGTTIRSLYSRVKELLQ